MNEHKEPLEEALCNLLEWAKGNRGSRCGNPYCVPEVRDALKVLARMQGLDESRWLDAETKTRKGEA